MLKAASEWEALISDPCLPLISWTLSKNLNGALLNQPKIHLLQIKIQTQKRYIDFEFFWVSS